MDINEAYLRLVCSGKADELEELLSSAHHPGIPGPTLNVNFVSRSDGSNALIVCAQCCGGDQHQPGDYEKCLKILLKRGIKLNAQDWHGRTALHWAVKNGLGFIVTELLRVGADIRIEDKNGRTPIQYGVNSSNLDIIRLLFEDDERKKVIPMNTILAESDFNPV